MRVCDDSGRRYASIVSARPPMATSPPAPMYLSDAELADRIRTGGPDADAAEAELFRRFGHRIRLYGRRHLRNDAEADDLVQQVLVVVLERLRAGTVRDPAQLASFVLGTCRLIARGQRGGEVRRQRLLDRYGGDATAPVSAPASAALDVARLRHCLERLTARERTVVVLTFYGDRSGDEIGAELGMTTGNVRVVRHRAVGRLQACMGLAEVAS